jgi:enamine deaminase RidA (YjgF/YER057c/UK114 family)
VLPDVPAPVANYVPWAQTGKFVFTSGQLPLKDGKLLQTGLVGDVVSLEEARLCARQCAINSIAAVHAAVGVKNVLRVVKLVGFVAAPAHFTSHPQVVNGASDLMVDVFGEMGRHARSAVGVAALPLNAPVEVEAIFEVS